ncbi:hypothetical protein D7X74_13355 [Corallococcus sp. CA047B]|uniref:hypothetical protein n=1 Tax=Corallococcus sp. CA047B TaxID=2316729 RepID=UPI000EA2D3B0|nr:hypothetical protein [Corallococcus sp. CA047B]RKH17159.1 hypothetical protein D7X74_13355 [Corallococcus sp. CA047B]
MHVRNWSALGWLGLVVAGCGVEDARGVTAQACPVGVASRVKAINSALANPTDVRGTFYFTTGAPGGGTILWRSDGTDAGTVQVRVYPTGIYAPGTTAAVGNTLYFQLAELGVAMEQLWLSDGTSSGTRFLRSFPRDDSIGPTSSLFSLTSISGRLVFFHVPPGGAPELWRSDGTSAGTQRVAQLPGVLGLDLGQTLHVGDALLFFRSQGGSTTLWRTDGTMTGTRALKQVDAGAVRITEVSLRGNPGLFIFQDGPNHEVWKTDGTAGGTFRLDAFGRPVQLLGTLGSSEYLASVEPTTSRLRIDRLSLGGGGKTLITTLPPNPAGLRPEVQRTTVSGVSLYFSVALRDANGLRQEVSLWTNNGTAAGTRQLSRTLALDDYNQSPVFATGGGVVLFHQSINAVSMPWFTRGTVATTGQLADVVVLGGSNPRQEPFVRSGNRIFFSAIEDTGLAQLWSAPVSFTCPPGLSE